MSAIRPQGRPRRGDTEVGRDRIISRLQAIFRCGTEMDCSRKTLAELAGVTPALISYYFPKREVLLEAISRPVIHNYRMEMERILKSPAPPDDKLRDVIKVLVTLYTSDGNLLDMYMNVMRKTGQYGNPAHCKVTQMTALLEDFLTLWRGPTSERSFDAAVMQGAVWGMCRFVARVEAEDRSFDEEVSPLVDRVVNFLIPEGSLPLFG